jgi:hypothetical protein
MSFIDPSNYTKTFSQAPQNFKNRKKFEMRPLHGPGIEPTRLTDVIGETGLWRLGPA